jgi:hypothetical protein
LGQGSFSAYLAVPTSAKLDDIPFNIRHPSFNISSEDSLADGLACRVLEFGAESADQAAFFFLGSLGVQGDRPAGKRNGVLK